MPVITDREEALKISDGLKKKGVPMCVFGTGSFWNTEAVLLAAQNFKKKNGIKDYIAVTAAITYDYSHMSQCSRFSYSKNLQVGLISNMNYLDELCGKPGSPYNDIVVLPHLDHADPVKDKWALTEGVDYFASVMFDAQTYSRDENIRLTSEYVDRYGKNVIVEGILDELSVNSELKHKTEAAAVDENNIENQNERDNEDSYIKAAVQYVNSTGVDFVVADLGTEQQSNESGDIVYLKDRAICLSRELGNKGIVLHGTSSMSNEQITQLGRDGIARINMWTKIARETGKDAAKKLMERYPLMGKGDFEAAESRQYIYDSIEYAAQMMENIMGLVGYGKL